MNRGSKTSLQESFPVVPPKRRRAGSAEECLKAISVYPNCRSLGKKNTYGIHPPSNVALPDGEKLELRRTTLLFEAVENGNRITFGLANSDPTRCNVTTGTKFLMGEPRGSFMIVNAVIDMSQNPPMQTDPEVVMNELHRLMDEKSQNSRNAVRAMKNGLPADQENETPPPVGASPDQTQSSGCDEEESQPHAPPVGASPDQTQSSGCDEEEDQLHAPPVGASPDQTQSSDFGLDSPPLKHLSPPIGGWERSPDYDEPFLWSCSFPSTDYEGVDYDISPSLFCSQ